MLKTPFRSVMAKVAAAVLLGLAGAGAAAHLLAQPPDPEQYARGLERRERVERMQVARVVGALGLRPGMRVADLGAGSGLFARPMARQVAPGGVVYAVDINPALLRFVERSANEQGITNIRTVPASPSDPGLEAPVDLIFICDAFHHFPDKPVYAQTLARHVVAGGRVAVIDFTDSWPDGHDEMRYTPADLDAWMTAAGFTRAQSFDFPENSFFVVYVKG